MSLLLSIDFRKACACSWWNERSTGARVDKVNIAEKLSQFVEPWVPRIVGELNGQHVKVAKMHGAFDWHHHDNEDEMFR